MLLLLLQEWAMGLKGVRQKGSCSEETTRAEEEEEGSKEDIPLSLVPTHSPYEEPNLPSGQA